MKQLMRDAEQALQVHSYKAFYLSLLRIFEQDMQALALQQAVFLHWLIRCKDISGERGQTGYEPLVLPLLTLLLEKSLRDKVQRPVLARLLQVHSVLATHEEFALLNERIALCFYEEGKQLLQCGSGVIGAEFLEAGRRLCPTALQIDRTMSVIRTRHPKRVQQDDVAVVIPVYRRQMSEYEQISLMQCRRVLSSYKKIYIAPASLRMEEYHQFMPDAQVMAFPDAFFQSVATYNRLLLSTDFYNKLESYSYILIYQLDAFVFEDKLQYYCNQGYDYLGAVWFDGRHVPVQGAKAPTITCYVGNGGFSLRHVNHSLRMLEMLGENVKKWPGNEDIFWSFCGAAYPAQFKVAPVDIAEQFSFELFPRQSFAKLGCLPFGCHAWEKYDIDFFREVFAKYGYHI